MSYKNQWPTNRLLSTAARLVEHAWNENLASLGITHAGVMALDVLRSEGSMTQAQLAHQVRVQAQTMGKTLHRLEVHGHITRSRNALDRRSHMVSISPAGERVLVDAARRELSVGTVRLSRSNPLVHPSAEALLSRSIP